VFGRKRERERGRRVALTAFPILDEMEAADWGLSTSPKKPTDLQLSAAQAARWMERLLAACENDPSILPLVVEGWSDNRSLRFESLGEGDRAIHVQALHLNLGITAYGNYFGLTHEWSPSFNAEEAAEGRSRGWRR